MSNSKLLLIDYYNLMYRNLYALEQLSFGGRKTGAIYGFISMTAKYILRFKPTNVVVCMDKKPYARSELYPQYKMDRKALADPDTVQYANTVLSLAFKTLGIPVVGISGLEADDIIAHLTQKYSDTFDIIIASNDSDLLQVLESNVIILGAKDKEWTLKSFNEAYPGIKPYHWPLVTAMVGSHNGVPGIKGIGIKTAMKLLTSKTLPELMEHLAAHKEDMLRNVNLARLPLKAKYYPQPLDVELPAMDEYNSSAFYELLKITGISFTSDMELAFEGTGHDR